MIFKQEVEIGSKASIHLIHILKLSHAVYHRNEADAFVISYNMIRVKQFCIYDLNLKEESFLNFQDRCLGEKMIQVVSISMWIQFVCFVCS